MLSRASVKDQAILRSYAQGPSLQVASQAGLAPPSLGSCARSSSAPIDLTWLNQLAKRYFEEYALRLAPTYEGLLRQVLHKEKLPQPFDAIEIRHLKLGTAVPHVSQLCVLPTYEAHEQVQRYRSTAHTTKHENHTHANTKTKTT
jgi:hypothetical protein